MNQKISKKIINNPDYLYYVDIVNDIFYQDKDLYINKEKAIFFPQIPRYRMDDENNTIKRICLGTNIQSCLTAASFDVDELPSSTLYCLYVFDKKDILLENYLSYKTLFEKQYVPDAYNTKECWVINQNLNPCNIIYFTLNSFEIEKIPILKTEEEYNSYYKDKYNSYKSKYLFKTNYIKKCKITTFSIEECPILFQETFQLSIQKCSSIIKHFYEYNDLLKLNIKNIISENIHIIDSFYKENTNQIIWNFNNVKQPFCINKAIKDLSSLFHMAETKIQFH